MTTILLRFYCSVTYQEVCYGQSSVSKCCIVAIRPSQHASGHRDNHTHILVAAVGNDVEPSEVRVHGEEIKTEPYQQHFGQEPGQQGTGCYTKMLWSEPAWESKEQ